MRWVLPGPQDPAQAARRPVSPASAEAAKAAASSWRVLTQSMPSVARRESVKPLSESPAIP